MMKTCLTLSFIVFTFFSFLFAQEAVSFKILNEFYIYGDATVIGNNILSKDAKEPFNDTSLTNDDIDMVFVDIDNNPSTFSSSSASLKLPENHKKIVYAVLYWSATYSYEQGYRQESGGQFLFQGKRVKKRDDIDNIKLKLPNGDYKNINGTVIFDGANDAAFTLNSPYVCMADVTKLLKNTESINGDYTVANVKATKGFVSGGSAAGWLLYVVYEAPTKNPKYITTYNGFADVSNGPLKIKFNNFKSLEKGEVQTALTFAVLEGDSALTKDECVLANPNSRRATLLSTDLRPRNNFFNSKITYSDNVFNDRFPKSENTLGFDIVSMDVPNNSQPLIDNNTTEIEMAFNTESDRFYVFFGTFQTEINKSFYNEKQRIDNILTNTESNDLAEANNKEERLAKEKTSKIKAGKKQLKKEKEQKEKVAREKIEKALKEKEASEKVEKAKIEIADKEKKLKEKTLKVKLAKEKVVLDKKEKLEKVKREKEKREKEEKAIKKPANIFVVGDKTPTKQIDVTQETFTPKTEISATETYKLSKQEKDKPLPIWLKQKQKEDLVTIADTNVYQPNITLIEPTFSLSSLVMNRENYEKLLTKEDYVYETQKFKRVLNQEPTYIEGIEKGYYAIAGLLYNLDFAIEYQKELLNKGVNSKIFKDKTEDKFYVYLYNSENFYDVFMLRKAFIKSSFLEQVWILNINIEKQVFKKL